MQMNSDIFNQIESEVRSYCRAFPAVFQKARGAFLYDELGQQYLDFFSGAGTLNYGHNNPAVKQAVIRYLEQDGVVHSLDMWTTAKREFLQAFEDIILKPRGLDYKVQFTGPTGTNAVEAALKLARKAKNRSNVVAFTNGYHGLSGNALATTGNRHFRTEAFINRLNVSFLPFDDYVDGLDSLNYFQRLIEDSSSGLDLPAAVILETIQAEGGINVARKEFLQGLEALCRKHDILIIVDDIQVGNGRTGDFFSFEFAGIRPDLVTVSKAIGGLGLPMAIVLINPKIDVWKPAEHTGTFRGNNLAFVAATAALQFWAKPEFSAEIKRKGELLHSLLEGIKAKYPSLNCKVRGRGLIYGLEIPQPGFAKLVSREAFKQKLIIELAGADDQVIKFLPPLVIEEQALRDGVNIVDQCIAAILSR
ncbi:MAG: diaminobutyrate/2-oxoglutarate aminotransferase [Verrucomicrobiales bacterium]|nr:diaminobutyrate/2-oxoglutarate aminotransferase [Verrucomicrobiales bacterium]